MPSIKLQRDRAYRNLRKWQTVAGRLIVDLMPDSTSAERREEIIRRFKEASAIVMVTQRQRRTSKKQIAARYDIELWNDKEESDSE